MTRSTSKKRAPGSKRKVDLILVGAGELVTLAGPPGPRVGRGMAELGAIADGALAVKDGMIALVGTSEQVLSACELSPEGMMIDAAGCLVIPGLVDPHTHAVFGAFRRGELALRLTGAAYMNIHGSGGGIHRTVRETREAPVERLLEVLSANLREMLCNGTTTAEVKSGYGLTLEHEARELAAIREARVIGPMDIESTFLGAHAIPGEFEGRADAYVELICEEMLPRVVHDGLARFCDVFCEPGAFSAAQSRRVLETARSLGLRLKVHADEFCHSGGAELAADLGAISADHLLKTTEEGLRALRASGTIAVLLPAAPFALSLAGYADARRMVELGIPVALGTDFNPGPGCVSSMQIIIGLACLQMKLAPAEALVAATLNAAHAVGRGEEVGSLVPGKQADFVVMNAESHEAIPYFFGRNLVSLVVKSGQPVVRKHDGLVAQNGR